MSKRITQSTFDEVVSENVHDFDMSTEQALADAIAQFTSQGVDLDSVDITGGIGVEELESAWRVVDRYLKASSPHTSHTNAQIDTLHGELTSVESANVVTALVALQSLCDTTYTYSARNLNLIRTKGYLHQLHGMIDERHPSAILIEVFALLRLSARLNIDNRDFFEPNGSSRLSALLKHYLATPELVLSNTKLVSSIYSLAAVVAKSENNKFMLFKEGLKDLILKTLRIDCRGNDAMFAVHESACLAMKGLCIHDDARRDMSCAMDNGKYFLSGGCVPLLMGLASTFTTRPTVASAALSACRQLVLTEEAVLVVAQHGAMELPKQILSWPQADAGLIRSVLGLARNLCADDNRKNKLVSDGSMALMVHAMRSEACREDSHLMEHGIACLAAMSLRFPSNAVKIVQCGATEVVTKAMTKFMASRPSLVRQGCLLIRNTAARCPELRAELLDAGVEPVLRAAGIDPLSAPEAYGALRDLGCDVQYVKVLEDGRVVSAYEVFGGEKKLQFNPVYDDRDDFISRVEENGQAPFKENKVASVIDHDHDHDHVHSSEGGCC